MSVRTRPRRCERKLRNLSRSFEISPVLVMYNISVSFLLAQAFRIGTRWEHHC